MNDRSKLLLAFGIAEYGTTITHLSHMREVGVEVPYGVIGRIQTEQRLLVSRWLVEHGEFVLTSASITERVVNEARQYLTERIEQLDALLEEEGQA